MVYRILTTSIAGIELFFSDPGGILSKAEGGTVAVLSNNTPVFYAINHKRLAQLLDKESKANLSLSSKYSDITQNINFSEEAISTSAVPIGKFAMYPGWQPNVDFQRLAALWGIAITQPVTPEELAAFIDYWQAEGKFFHHVQWQQKLARSVHINRSSKFMQQKNYVNLISESNFDSNIPKGFRG